MKIDIFISFFLPHLNFHNYNCYTFITQGRHLRGLGAVASPKEKEKKKKERTKEKKKKKEKKERREL